MLVTIAMVYSIGACASLPLWAFLSRFDKDVGDEVDPRVAKVMMNYPVALTVFRSVTWPLAFLVLLSSAFIGFMRRAQVRHLRSKNPYPREAVALPTDAAYMREVKATLEERGAFFDMNDDVKHDVIQWWMSHACPAREDFLKERMAAPPQTEPLPITHAFSMDFAHVDCICELCGETLREVTESYKPKMIAGGS